MKISSYTSYTNEEREREETMKKHERAEMAFTLATAPQNSYLLSLFNLCLLSFLQSLSHNIARPKDFVGNKSTSGNAEPFQPV